MRYRSRLIAGVAALVLVAATPGASLAAFQIVELSAETVVPGAVVTMRVEMTRIAGTEPSPLFLIPSGTFGDSPSNNESCEDVARAIEVGETHWQAGMVEFEGALYEGVIGGATFTVPDLQADTYRIAETIDAQGTLLCHIFAAIQVVASLPDTALPVGDAAGARDLGGSTPSAREP